MSDAVEHWDDVEPERRDVGEMRARSREAWVGRVLVRLDPADDYWEGEL